MIFQVFTLSRYRFQVSLLVVDPVTSIFIKMDLDVDDEILYNMDIKALPTIMVFKNAKGVGRIEGLREPVVRDVLSKLQ